MTEGEDRDWGVRRFDHGLEAMVLAKRVSLQLMRYIECLK